MKCLKIRIKNNRCYDFFVEKIYKTKHFENILLILINQDYKMNEGKHFKYLLDSTIMRAVVSGNSGGKNKKEHIEYMKSYYANNQTMNDLISVGKELKIHNLVEQIKDIKKNYQGYFTKLKQGDTSARPPKPKKLKKCNHITLFMDGYKSHSFSKKNKIGININSKMMYIYVKHEPLLEVLGSFDNVKNINLNYSNGFLYLLINYENKPSSLSSCGDKVAGLDIGVNNLASIYIDDKESNSLIISGNQYKHYNAQFNRLIAQLSSDSDYWYSYATSESKKPYNEGLDVFQDIRSINNFKRFLFEKRNNFFYSEFHKLSKRILEYLHSKGVSTLVVSTSLGNLKNNGNCKMRKSAKQSFIQIPFMELIHNLKDKAAKFDIVIVDVNEAYTSKTSTLSADINEIQQLGFDNQNLSTNDFKGSRVKRGLFRDHVFRKMINADLNGASNILKIFTKQQLKTINYRKLCNPIVVKSDHDLIALRANNSCVG